MTDQHVEMEAGKNFEVTVESVGGALHVKGWERDKWRIDFPHDDDRFEQNKNKLTVKAASDCILRLPTESRLKILSVGGDVHLSGVEGPIALEHAGGSAHVKRVGHTTLGAISGNLGARDVEGNLTAERVSGNATLRQIAGSVELEQVGGNLTLRDVEGNLSTNVGGNATLRLITSPKAKYKVSSGGHTTCRVEPPGDARVSLVSEGKNILVQTDEATQNLEGKSHDFEIGKPDASIDIRAGGTISFRCREEDSDFYADLEMDFGEDFESMVDEISEQVSVQMEAQLDALNQQLDTLTAQLQVSGDRAVRSAQRKVQAAQRRLESKLKARGHGQHKQGQRSFAGAAFDEPEEVSEEERMMVLEMVQEKKISVDEAEMLLATLEGRELPEKGVEKGNRKGKDKSA